MHSYKLNKILDIILEKTTVVYKDKNKNMTVFLDFSKILKKIDLKIIRDLNNFECYEKYVK